MRFSPHFRCTARSWKATLLTLAVGISGLAAAQAPVTRAEISTDLLLSLLGSGNAIEIELPGEVRAVHVVAVQGDAVLINRSASLDGRGAGDSASVVVSVGAVGPTLRCPLMVFIAVNHQSAGATSGGGMNSICLEVNAPVTLRPVPQSFHFRASFDVGRWYAIDGFWPAETGPGAPQPVEDDIIVFHVFLATDNMAPSFEEPELRDRFRRP